MRKLVLDRELVQYIVQPQSANDALRRPRVESDTGLTQTRYLSM